MVYTFYSPWGRAETREAILATVKKMGGKAREISPGCISAKWRSPQYATIFPTEFRF